LRQSTVFATVSGSFSNKITNGSIHHEPSCASTPRAFDLRMATKSNAST
jgi:hypothetical protein